MSPLITTLARNTPMITACHNRAYTGGESEIAGNTALLIPKEVEGLQMLH